MGVGWTGPAGWRWWQCEPTPPPPLPAYALGTAASLSPNRLERLKPPAVLRNSCTDLYFYYNSQLAATRNFLCRILVTLYTASRPITQTAGFRHSSQTGDRCRNSRSHNQPPTTDGREIIWYNKNGFGIVQQKAILSMLQ